MLNTKIEDMEELTNQIRYFKQQSKIEKEVCWSVSFLHILLPKP